MKESVSFFEVHQYLVELISSVAKLCTGVYWGCMQIFLLMCCQLK